MKDDLRAVSDEHDRGRLLPSDGRTALQITFITLGALALISAIAWLIPFDMDEFLPYHSTACGFPSQQLNVYEGGCGAYPTSLFGFEFQRSFNYVGASTGWLLAPLLAVWPSWWAHTASGIVFLIICTVGVVVSLRLSWKFAPAALLYFPLTYGLVRGLGPIGISMVALVWSPVLLRVFVRTQSAWRRWAVVVGMALAWIIATESKPFFLFLIPGVICWSIAALVVTGEGEFLLQRWRSVTALFAGVSASCLALLIVMRVEGQTYLEYLLGFPSPNHFLLNIGTGATFILDWPFAAHRVMYLYPNVDSRFFEPLQAPLNALPWGDDRGGFLALGLTVLAVLAVIGLYAWAIRRLLTSGQRVKVLVTTAAAGVLFAGALLSAGGSSHHYVFAHVPLMALCLLAFATMTSGYVKGGFILLGISALSLLAVLSVPVKPSVSRNIDTLMNVAYADADASTIINCASWGCYHQYALLNRDNVPIVFAEKPDQQAALLEVARARGSNLEHMCLECDLATVESAYPGTTVKLTMTTDDGWALYRVQPQ
jgi:hypothetical protein